MCLPTFGVYRWLLRIAVRDHLSDASLIIILGSEHPGPLSRHVRKLAAPVGATTPHAGDRAQSARRENAGVSEMDVLRAINTEQCLLIPLGKTFGDLVDKLRLGTHLDQLVLQTLEGRASRIAAEIVGLASSVSVIYTTLLLKVFEPLPIWDDPPADHQALNCQRDTRILILSFLKTVDRAHHKR